MSPWGLGVYPGVSNQPGVRIKRSMPMSFAMESPIALRAGESARATFIRRTYAHLAGAILAFTAIEFLIFGLVPKENLDQVMLRYVVSSPWTQLLVLFAFMGIAMLAGYWAQSETSQAVQYFGL